MTLLIKFFIGKNKGVIMYNQQQTSDRKLKKEKEKLFNRKARLETTTEIKTYLAWLKLPVLDKKGIEEEWSDYYGEVKTSKAFKEYFEMSSYWKDRNMEKVRELASLARKRLENQNWELVKPHEADPWEFSRGIYYRYKMVCNQIRYISQQLTGVADVEDIFKERV